MSAHRDRTIAGLAILGGSAVIVLGFITAAALYPGYSIAHDTISALGAAGGSAASTLVFNGAMIVGGVLTLVAGSALHAVYGDRWFTGVLVVTAVGGYVGVGLFPAQTGVPHTVAALIAFGGTGIAALLATRVVAGPFRYVSMVLGGGELFALGLFIWLGGANPLGVGGLERWVAYLGVIWALVFAGYLLATATRSETGEPIG